MQPGQSYLLLCTSFSESLVVGRCFFKKIKISWCIWVMWLNDVWEFGMPLKSRKSQRTSVYSQWLLSDFSWLSLTETWLLSQDKSQLESYKVTWLLIDFFLTFPWFFLDFYMTFQSSSQSKKNGFQSMKVNESPATFHWLLPDFLFYRAWHSKSSLVMKSPVSYYVMPFFWSCQVILHILPMNETEQGNQQPPIL